MILRRTAAVSAYGPRGRDTVGARGLLGRGVESPLGDEPRFRPPVHKEGHPDCEFGQLAKSFGQLADSRSTIKAWNRNESIVPRTNGGSS